MRGAPLYRGCCFAAAISAMSAWTWQACQLDALGGHVDDSVMKALTLDALVRHQQRLRK